MVAVLAVVNSGINLTYPTLDYSHVHSEIDRAVAAGHVPSIPVAATAVRRRNSEHVFGVGVGSADGLEGAADPAVAPPCEEAELLPLQAVAAILPPLGPACDAAIRAALVQYGLNISSPCIRYFCEEVMNHPALRCLGPRKWLIRILFCEHRSALKTCAI